MKKNTWKTLEGQKINDIYETLELEFAKAYEENNDCIVYIGTDSQNIARQYTSFVQVVAVHIIRPSGIGSGGRVFFIRHLERRYARRATRLLRETEISINLAQKIEPVCSEYGIPFEVHADVHSLPGKNNENKSHEVHDQVRGWIEGMGYECRTKPNAFVSSIVADRHTRGLRYKRQKGHISKKRLATIEE